jgi:hypothetical protein
MDDFTETLYSINEARIEALETLNRSDKMSELKYQMRCLLVQPMLRKSQC